MTSLSPYYEITRRFSQRNDSRYVVITRSPENLFKVLFNPIGAPYVSLQPGNFAQLVLLSFARWRLGLGYLRDLSLV